MKSNTFKELVKRKNLTDDNYPHAEFGLDLRKIIRIIFIFLISMIIILQGGTYLFTNYVLDGDVIQEQNIAVEEKIENTEKEDDDNMLSKTFGNMASGLSGSLSNTKGVIVDKVSSVFTQEGDIHKSINKWLTYLSRGLGLLIAVYLFNVFQRARMYERNIIINDGKSIKYTRKIKNYLDVRSKLRVANESYEKDKTNSANMHRLNAIKKLANLQLKVNTRQSDMEDVVRTQYRIILSLPFYIDERNILLSEVDKLQMSATYILSGKAKFGSQIIDEDSKIITWRAISTETDKYALTSRKGESSDSLPSETSFPLDLFVDRQSVIAERKEQAMDWAKLTAETIDKILSSKQEQVTAISILPGNKNAVFIYEMSFSVNPKQFKQYEELFDQTFKTEGSMVRIDKGKLEITIPMPKEYEIPIDMATMVKGVFG